MRPRRPGLAALALAALTHSAPAAGDFDPAAATNQLGLQLCRTLAADVSVRNVVLSPYSIESALALVYAGAEGVTRTEMSRALGFPDDDAVIAGQLARLRDTLDHLAAVTQRAAEAGRGRGGKLDPIEWHAANRLFGQQGYAFRDSFLTLMRDRYAAPFQTMRFRENPDAERTKINGWVEEQTRQKIRNLIPGGALKKDTRLVLVNALYLKAPWEKPFEKRATQPLPFHLPAGGDRSVPMMHLTGTLGYAREAGRTIVTLDYLGRWLQFVVILPDEGTSPDALATRLTADDFARWAKLAEGNSARVALALPKFRVEGTTVPLGGPLRTLGMRSAFDDPVGSANFERIAPRRPTDYLAVSEVFHQTFIAVDEEGTEAAAATAGAMLALASMREDQPIEVRVDRPFLFAIQHRMSGACLFLGRISDPR